MSYPLKYAEVVESGNTLVLRFLPTAPHAPRHDTMRSESPHDPCEVDLERGRDFLLSFPLSVSLSFLPEDHLMGANLSQRPAGITGGGGDDPTYLVRSPTGPSTG